MTDEHDARRAGRPGPHADQSASDLPALAAAAASASASLSVLDIPAIVRRRARPRTSQGESWGESSGFVDISDLCFGDGLARAPITPLVPMLADVEPTSRPAAERGLLWAMMAAAAIAVATMFAVAIGREPATVIVRAPAEAAPAMAASDRVVEPGPEAVEAPAAIAEPEDDDAAAPTSLEPDLVIEPEPEPQPEPEPSSRSTSRSGSTRTSSRPKADPARGSKDPAPSTPEPTKSGSGDTPVECILDPASCGLGGSGSTSRAPKVTEPAEALPGKLGTTALRTVLGQAKASARACGPRHGAATGTQVQVKLSINGASGRVVSATPMGAHAGTALGRCVADALSEPVFPRFSAAQQGVVWPIRL